MRAIFSILDRIDLNFAISRNEIEFKIFFVFAQISPLDIFLVHIRSQTFIFCFCWASQKSY